MGEFKKQPTAPKFNISTWHSPVFFGFSKPLWRCLKHPKICFLTLNLSSVWLKQYKQSKICIYRWNLLLSFLPFCYKGYNTKKCLEHNFCNFICSFLLCPEQWPVNNTKNLAFLKLFLLNRNRHLPKFSLQLLGSKHNFCIEIIKHSKGNKFFKI